MSSYREHRTLHSMSPTHPTHLGKVGIRNCERCSIWINVIKWVVTGTRLLVQHNCVTMGECTPLDILPRNPYTASHPHIPQHRDKRMRFRRQCSSTQRNTTILNKCHIPVALLAQCGKCQSLARCPVKVCATSN